jgi:purine-binding chemotaxis protein CheW
VSTKEANAAAVRQYLSFIVGGTDFGVPILKVKEILQYEGVTRVPGTPGSIRGVINVRGSVVPVVDLGVKFGKGEVPETKRTCVLVVETKTKDETLTLGVIADAVSEVVDLANDDIEPPPSFGTGVKLDHITGMGKVGKGFVILLDIDRVLTASEADLAAATAAAAQANAEKMPEAKPAAAAAAQAAV